MPLHIDVIPRVLCCPRCGYHIQNVTLSKGFELFVARTLRAELASERVIGYDVCDSELYPNWTFRVEYSEVVIGLAKERVKGGRLCENKPGLTWAWRENIDSRIADWYVLFGIRDNLVYPFVLSQADWLKASFKCGEGRIHKTTAQEYSHCGGYTSGYERSELWNHYVSVWPDGLHAVLAVQQSKLC